MLTRSEAASWTNGDGVWTTGVLWLTGWGRTLTTVLPQQGRQMVHERVEMNKWTLSGVARGVKALRTLVYADTVGIMVTLLQ